MIGTFIFHSVYNSIVHLQSCEILLAIHPTMSWYCWTYFSKTRSSYRIQIRPIQIYLLCHLLIIIVMYTYLCHQRKNKYQFPIPYQMLRPFLVHSVEIGSIQRCPLHSQSLICSKNNFYFRYH